MIGIYFEIILNGRTISFKQEFDTEEEAATFLAELQAEEIARNISVVDHR